MPGSSPNRVTASSETLTGYLAAVLATAVATAVGWVLYHGLHLPDASRHPFLANTNVLMLYLLAVLWIATRHPRGAAVLASILGVIAFDICFVPPYLKLGVEDEQYLMTFAVMLLTALVISTLTHRARTQVLAAQQAWERAEAEFLRNTLLSSVSHDLRTPIAGIVGATSTLIESGKRLSPGAHDEMLATIYAEAERMERLINNLLQMTRVESGGLLIRKEWQHVPEILGSALQHLTKRLADRPLTTRIDPEVPLVSVDSVAIEQVLVNLVDNAIEHTPPGSPIDISITSNASAVVIEVADRGTGLPLNAESRVFDKFFHAATPGSGHRIGLGLGLAICKGLIDAHGGTIRAANRPEGGAVFHIELPRKGPPPPSSNREA